jgi:IS5 family transposase
VRNQQMKDSNKVLSLHESHVYAITKGKDHKKYEYGTKASIVATKDSGVIVGVASHSKNEHDSKTLELAITSANATRTSPIKEAICDRGYRGIKEVLGTTICIPATPLKRDSEYQKQKKREKFKRRAAIEPIIGHLKSDFRLARNYLKGFIGDQINLLLAATAWNMKKWMNIYFWSVFLEDLALTIQALVKLIPTKMQFTQLITLKVFLVNAR